MAKTASLPAGAGKGFAELRSRLWFVFLALLVYRIGAHIPVPGINPDRLAALFDQNQGGTILSLFNMFSGGALERMSIFALGIMPYISASIIMQLMTAVSPQLEQLKKKKARLVVARSASIRGMVRLSWPWFRALVFLWVWHHRALPLMTASASTLWRLFRLSAVRSS